MKNRSQYALLFSGYPLSVADKKKEKDPPVFKLALNTNTSQTTFIQSNKITNDPRQWDVNWFGSYE